MDSLDDISVGELQDALEEVDGKKPTQRLLAAIAHKNGVTQTELAEWYGVQRRTIYSWLSGLDGDRLTESVCDDKRSGRPRKLTDDQQRRLRRTLRQPPTEAGYDATNWTPKLVCTHLADTHDVEYSIPSCRRLLKEAGLRYRNARWQVAQETGADDDA